MTLEETLHQAILAVDGVGKVYSADPAWRVAVSKLGELLSTGQATAELRFVDVVRDEDAGTTVVRARVGAHGGVPAPAVARAVAKEVRRVVLRELPGTRLEVKIQLSSLA